MSDQQMHGFRVATLNLWGRSGDWPARRRALAAGLADLGPDVVAFQESVVTHDADQLREVLGAGWHVLHQQGRETDGTGLSIAARWPLRLVSDDGLLVSDRVHPDEFAGRMGLAEIMLPPPVGPVLLVHLKPSWQLGFERERELQSVAAARRVEEHLQRRPPLHVVLLGDFDSTPDSASGRFWSGRQSLEGTSVCYRDVWEVAHPDDPGHTFSPDNPLVTSGTWPTETGRRVDRILVRCNEHGPTLRIASAFRLFDRPTGGTWASDHFGVCVDLRPI